MGLDKMENGILSLASPVLLAHSAGIIDIDS